MTANVANPGNPAPITQSMGILDWVMLLTLSVLWGGSFFFQGVAVKELPTFTIVNLRVAIAAVVLWLAILLLRKTIPANWKVWGAFLIMGALNNVMPFTLIVWGQHSIGSGLASILNATTPLFTVLAAGTFLADEPVSPRKLTGVVIGFLGVALMIGPFASKGLSGDVVAQLACLAAAISYALAGVFGRRFKAMQVEPLVVAAGQTSASTLLLLLPTAMIDRPWLLAMPGPQTWQAVVSLAVLSTAFAYFLYFKILGRAGATNLLLVTFLIPVTGILLGWLFLGERLGLGHFGGMVLIGAGLAFIDGRLVRRFQQQGSK